MLVRLRLGQIFPAGGIYMGSTPQNQSLTHREKDQSYLEKLAVKGEDYFKQHPSSIEKILEQKIESTASKIALYLSDRPHLQQKLAEAVNYSPSEWLLEKEIRLVRARRAIHTSIHDPEDSETDGVYQWACKHRLLGLCFSGGGIRSATFNLGILQGLARLDVLEHVDYLSSVSGGGYIHEWFAAWIKREEEERKNSPTYVKGDGFREVKRRLVPQPLLGKDHPAQPEPIRWLRRYSNYLTPQKGLLTADTWAAVSIWLRNTFLNQVILVSGLFFLLTGPYLIKEFVRQPSTLLSFFSILSCLIAVATIFAELLHEHRRIRALDDKRQAAPKHEPPRSRGGKKTIQLLVVAPLLLASLLHMNVVISSPPHFADWYDATENMVVFGLLWLLVAAASAAGGSVQAYINLHEIKPPDAGKSPQPAAKTKTKWWQQLTDRATWTRRWEKARQYAKVAVAGAGGLVIVTAILSAFTGTLYFLGVRWMLSWSRPAWIPSSYLGGPPGVLFQIVFGPPLLLSVPFFTIVIAAGLVGRDFPDWLREWLARVRGWAWLVGFGWTFLVGICLLGPFVVCWLETSSKLWLPAVIGWLGTTAGSVFAGKSKKTGGTPAEMTKPAISLNLLAKVGAYVFIVGLLMVISVGVRIGFDWWSDSSSGFWGFLVTSLPVILTPLAIFLIFGWRVDVNEFSMNPFYRNRLTRCYLGASNRYRDPNPLTGFDDRDTRGMQIARLTPFEPKPETPDEVAYTGPLPIVCTTLNLSFGEDLAWQERKAASFAFGPVCSGYDVAWTAGKPGTKLNYCGFVATEDYAIPCGGINMATAVAISGAAASPNMGYHTDPATAFLMTMFNVRLGWWLFNPRRPQTTTYASPAFAPKELIRELLGMVDDTSKFVYLSDGGHFENMGLYELVRRRCYRIVICDSEQDEKYFFEGIGNAIRKCRIDFGAEITLDLSKLRVVPATGNSVAHFAPGTICYPETPEGQTGTILYIKSSLTGASKYPITENWAVDLPAEPIDVLNYKFMHEHFPHDTTADQWFTESQFESYRRLGDHIVDEIKDCNMWSGF
jgi:hypothetical protein